MEDKIIVFPSVYLTLLGEQALEEKNIKHQVIPVPPYVNEGCGLGIKVEASLLEEVLQVFIETGIKTEKVV